MSIPCPRVRVTGEPWLAAGLAAELAACSELQLTETDADVVVWALESPADLPRLLQWRQELPQQPLLIALRPLPVAQLQPLATLQPVAFWQTSDPTEALLARLLGLARGESVPTPLPSSEVRLIRHPAHARGLCQIDQALLELGTCLPQAPLWQRPFLQGRQRELQAARRLLDWLYNQGRPTPPFAGLEPASAPVSGDTVSEPAIELSRLRARLWDRLAEALAPVPVSGVSEPLELDILNGDRRRELLRLLLRLLADRLDELEQANLSAEALRQRGSRVALDLWQEALAEFYGRYGTVAGPKGPQDLLPLLSQAEEGVRSLIGNLGQWEAVAATLLRGDALPLDNRSVSCRSPEAQARLQLLLEDWLIRLGNAVVWPLLNLGPEADPLRRSYYDFRWLSTRELTRFRNQLNWRTRCDRWYGEPRDIYESRRSLYHLEAGVIRRVSIYQPRQQDLESLQGVAQSVTLALELRDAIAPQLTLALGWLGNGLVFVLTQVVGRGLGLVGRGILQGLGQAVSRRDGERGGPMPL